MGPVTPEDPVPLLAREARGLVDRLRLWTPARWAASAPVLGSRAGVVHHLAQALADAAAAAEGEPARLLPRLDADLALPDQLAVTADDLVRSRPSARVARDALAHLLWHRAHLLDEPVPASLAARLGLPDGAAVLAEGRAACRGPSG
jgi:hypothetical protein